MKRILPILLAAVCAASPTRAQSPSPAAGSPAPAAASASAAGERTDLYHVHFAKAAPGKAAALAETLQKQAPDAPHPGHYIVLRHQDGDDWDYCAIEHLGPKATVEAVRPAPPASQLVNGYWHTDTYVNGPAWATFAKELGLDDAAKSKESVYVVSVYRAVPGEREGLDKFLAAPPNPGTDTASGNVVLQHLEGAAWTFATLTRYNSWSDFAKNEAASVAQMTKKDSGWFKLRELVSYHADTLCDRLQP